MSIKRRVFCFFFSVCLCVSAVLSVSIPVSAAATDIVVAEITDMEGNTLSQLTYNKTVNILLTYTETAPPPGMADGMTFVSTSVANISPNSIWKKNENTSASATVKVNEKNSAHYDIKLEVLNITYASTQKIPSTVLTFTEMVSESDSSILYTCTLRTEIPKEYFEAQSGGISIDNSGGDSTASEEPAPTSDILIESVSVTDKNNKKLDEVTKDTPAFNISVVYVDYGLYDYDAEYLSDNDISVYLTNAGSFVPAGNNRGTIRPLQSRSDGFARFRVDFTNVTWDGTSNSIAIQVRYDIDGRSFKGDTQAVVYQAKAKTEEEESEEEAPIIPPPTPYIIVTQYSSGEGAIEAGQIFTLDLTFKNTSKLLGLENIIMTVSPDDDLSIATASNTFYIDSLAADATLQRSVEIEAKPTASVGSHTLNITFSYEYLVQKSADTSERQAKESKEAIAVSISQIDRFAVDPITEIPAGFIGEAAYLPVTFTNKGKSTTYNISATARGNLEILSPTEHYGNLDPGKNDSLDVTIVPQVPGELYGEIVFTYEDENTNQKEITVPFTMYIEEPYVPPVTPDPGMIDPGLTPEEPTTNVAQIIFLAIGAILMAVPIALYLMKRVKAKGSEDFEDDL